MIIARSLNEFLQLRAKIPAGKRIGLVPTMGALHDGHASLARKSVEENDITIASIFVNPTQFGPNEDLAAYPRTLEADAALLEALGTDIIFAPDTREIYPESGGHFTYEIIGLSDKLCGRSRPGHMNGVVQVVSILFHIVRPTHAYFGKKDYQQCLIIRKMVEEMHFQLTVVPCETVREPDGLAMSSRNRYLGPDERKQAICLYDSLNSIRKNTSRFSSVDEIIAFVRKNMEKYPLVRLDYFELLNGHDLSDLNRLSPEDKPVAFMAAYVGKARLIDNMELFTS
jgi:pantoate--beta-alanine ligase